MPAPCALCGADTPAAAAFCPRCGARLAGSPDPAATDPPGSDTGVRLGRVLGDGYQVRRLVGRGGFAEVFEVLDRGLTRRLAVKVLRPDIAWTTGMLARFTEECRTLARLSHPNILPIHFVGEGDGLTYYVMPFVEGHSLAEYLRVHGALDAGRALDIAIPVLHALAHAHDAGLLHRDIKPDNILIDAATGRALLVDFGIAKRLDGESTHTQTGFVVGTPQYMSPEQALGQSGLDSRSDVYAFGALLFQMVTGAPPFEGDSSQEIVGKHLAEPVPAPVDRNARIPVWLSDIIVRCLAKKPADRFQSVRALIDALESGRASGSARTESAGQVQDRVSQQHLPELGATGPVAERSAGSGALAASPRAGAGGRPDDRKPAPTPASDDRPPEPTPAIAARPPEPQPRRARWVALMLILGLAAGGWWLAFGRPAELMVSNRFDAALELRDAEGNTWTVPPQGQSALRFDAPGFVRLEWSVPAKNGPDGRPRGDAPSGELTAELARGRLSRALGLDAARLPMFEPLITNATDQPIAITVNYGLAGARSCDCAVPPGAVRESAGYYPLYQNTTVRATVPGGRSAMFRDLGPEVNRRVGQVGLRFESRDFR